MALGMAQLRYDRDAASYEGTRGAAREVREAVRGAARKVREAVRPYAERVFAPLDRLSEPVGRLLDSQDAKYGLPAGSSRRLALDAALTMIPVARVAKAAKSAKAATNGLANIKASGNPELVEAVRARMSAAGARVAASRRLQELQNVAATGRVPAGFADEAEEVLRRIEAPNPASTRMERFLEHRPGAASPARGTLYGRVRRTPPGQIRDTLEGMVYDPELEQAAGRAAVRLGDAATKGFAKGVDALSYLTPGRYLSDLLFPKPWNRVVSRLATPFQYNWAAGKLADMAIERDDENNREYLEKYDLERRQPALEEAKTKAGAEAAAKASVVEVNVLPPADSLENVYGL